MTEEEKIVDFATVRDLLKGAQERRRDLTYEQRAALFHAEWAASENRNGYATVLVFLCSERVFYGHSGACRGCLESCLDCTGMSGFGFGPLVFDLWVCLPGPQFPHRFCYGFGAKSEPRGGSWHRKLAGLKSPVDPCGPEVRPL